MSGNSHEYYGRTERVVRSSDRGFGIVFFVLCFLIGGIKFWLGHWAWLPWISAAMVIILVALFRPSLLGPFNRQWTNFGLFLFKFTNPIIMALIFFGVFLPIGLLVRSTSQDFFRRKHKTDAASYWVMTETSAAVQSMRAQF